MPEKIVTILRCTTCGKSRLKRRDGRFWCAPCGDWRDIRPSQFDVTAEWHDFGLQPLRLSRGWRVAYNNALYEVDPDPNLIPENERWWVFKEDMLMLRHDAADRLIDVGWYPEGDLTNGAYGLVLHEGSHTGPQLETVTTRSRQHLVQVIERMADAVTRGVL